MTLGLPPPLSRVIILIFLLAASVAAQPGTMKFDRISVEHGLSNFTVTAIAQDHEGFLWFGTEDGLNRYDGYTFTVFRNDRFDSTTLAASIIHSLHVDPEGTLWAGTVHALNRYDPATGSFRRYSGGETAPTQPGPWIVQRIRTLDDSTLILGTSLGLYRYERRTDRIVPVRIRGERIRDYVVALGLDDAGTVWAGTSDKGVLALDLKKDVMKRFTFDLGDTTRRSNNHIVSLLPERDGSVWIGSIGGLLRLNPVTGAFREYRDSDGSSHGLGEDIILDLLQDRNGILWAGTFHLGLCRYDPMTDRFHRNVSDPEDPRSLINNRVERLFEDRSGILWATSYRGGLNRHNPRTAGFTHFRLRGSKQEGINGSGVYAVCEGKDGSLWFGTFGGGLTRYDSARNRFMYHGHDPRNPASLSSGNVLALHEDRDGVLWVGAGNVLKRLDRTSGRFTKIPLHGPGNASTGEIKAIREDREGELWVGTNGNGVFRVDRSTNRYVRLAGPDALSAVWCIFEDRQGVLWFGSFGGGVVRFEKKTGEMKTFVADPSAPRGLSTSTIYSVVEDDRGILWIGTFGGGLNRYDQATGEFRSYSEKDGLPNNFVKGIIPDRGHLWLSTDRGLSRFDPETETFTNFLESDGLQGNVFLSGAYHRGASGRFYFGGENGVTAFFPGRITRNPVVPPVVITSFRVFDQAAVFPGALSRAKEIVLSHDQNFFSFEFVAMDFSAPERNQYAYMLEGVDQRWIQAGTRRHVSYTHLPPGSYRFRVRGSNGDGVWNEQGVSLDLVIAPPFWETWWFRILAGGMLIALAGTAYRYRVRKLVELERLRVRIASDLHDDIGSSLTKISLQSELIQEGIEPDHMQTYLKNIASSSRELVTTMSDIVWSIDARNDRVGNLVDRIRDFATSTLGIQHVDVTVTHDGLDGKKKIPVDVRENIYLICKEAVNNIARHSDATAVTIALTNHERAFRMVVADNGSGIDGSGRLSGHGIRNMTMRAERIGGTVQFLNEQGFQVVLTRKPL